MKKFTTILLLCSTALITPAHAELTGYFEEVKKPTSVRPDIVKKTATATPNLIAVAEKHAKDLSLSTKQKAAILVWKEDNSKHMRVLMLKTAALENISTEKALKGAKKEDVLSKVEQANGLRKKIAAQKLDCRNNLRSVLNDKQWTKLIAFYDADKQKIAAKPSQGLGTN